MTEQKNNHIIDTRFTWSGDKAKDGNILSVVVFGQSFPRSGFLLLI